MPPKTDSVEEAFKLRLVILQPFPDASIGFPNSPERYCPFLLAQPNRAKVTILRKDVLPFRLADQPERFFLVLPAGFATAFGSFASSSSFGIGSSP